MAKNTNTEKRTYEVRSPINHDQERYEVGESTDLDDKHAAPLLASGAIAAPAPKDAPKK